MSYLRFVEVPDWIAPSTCLDGAEMNPSTGLADRTSVARGFDEDFDWHQGEVVTLVPMVGRPF